MSSASLFTTRLRFVISRGVGHGNSVTVCPVNELCGPHLEGYPVSLPMTT